MNKNKGRLNCAQSVGEARWCFNWIITGNKTWACVWSWNKVTNCPMEVTHLILYTTEHSPHKIKTLLMTFFDTRESMTMNLYHQDKQLTEWSICKCCKNCVKMWQLAGSFHQHMALSTWDFLARKQTTLFLIQGSKKF